MKIGSSYNKNNVKTAVAMAWPSIIESFFVAFAGLVDSFMVSSLGSYAVASVGLTTQPKFIGLSLFFAVNVAISALVARRYGENRRDLANNYILRLYLLWLPQLCLVLFWYVQRIILSRYAVLQQKRMMVPYSISGLLWEE